MLRTATNKIQFFQQGYQLNVSVNTKQPVLQQQQAQQYGSKSSDKISEHFARGLGTYIR